VEVEEREKRRAKAILAMRIKSRELCVLLESLRTYWGIEGVFFYALALKYDEN